MKQLQQQNKQNVDLLSAYFQHRSEPNYAWSRACSMYQTLPVLRGFWPTSSVDYTTTNRGIDLSGQGNHLTENGNPQWGYDALAPYVAFDGAGDYLSRADGGAANWADIIGTETYVVNTQRGLTLGCWVYFDNAAGANEMIVNKWNGAGQRSYRLIRTAAGTIQFSVSVDGTAITSVSSVDTPAASGWYFVAGRFEPSTEMSVFVNDEITDLAVGVPASIWDSNQVFAVGRQSNGGNLMTGRVSMVFLCAARLDDGIVLSLYEQTKAMYGV